MIRGQRSAARSRGLAAPEHRPATHFARFHDRTRRAEASYVYECTWGIMTLIARCAYRARGLGTASIPENGPVIIIANHASFMDHFFLGAFAGRQIAFMAKSQLFRGPVQYVYQYGGVFPVRQGHQDPDAMETSRRVLDRGGCLVMYPEGRISRDGRLGMPKPGVGYLALQTGVPVLPAAILDAHRIHGTMRRLVPPAITVQFGTPMRWERREEPTGADAQEVADRAFDEVRALHQQLECLGHDAARASGPLSRTRMPRRLAALAGRPVPDVALQPPPGEARS